MPSPGERLAAHREDLRALSDRELVALISDAMARMDLAALAEYSRAMAERKKAA